jgi:DinB superfamily
MEGQFEDIGKIFVGISEEKSLHRYAPENWSIRQVLSHLNDTEPGFAFRAWLFGRDFHGPLPGFDQNVSVNAARADEYAWASHVAEFPEIWRATVELFRKLPGEAWGG